MGFSLPTIDQVNQTRYLAFFLLLVVVFTRPECTIMQGLAGVLAGVALPTQHIAQVLNGTA